MVRKGEIAQCHRIRRVERDRLFEQKSRLGHIFPGETPDMPMGAHRAVPCVELVRVLAPGLLHLGRYDAGSKFAGDRLRDLVLHREHIGEFAIIAVGPQVSAARRIDQLRGDPRPVAGTPDATFEDVTDAQSRAALPTSTAGPL